MSAPNILRINSSARKDGSLSRELSSLLADALAGETGNVVVRDLADRPVPQVDADWVGANFTDPSERSDAQRETLKGSDALISELHAADHIVIGVAMYNFSIPSSLKAWIDQVARARETFRYSEAGPEGLLKGKTAWLVMASGGARLDSEADFATPYLRFILGFLGITDVRVIDGMGWPFLEDDQKDAVRELARTATAETLMAAE
ncbi:MAG: FMN-dependent NADH-azoreductase [Oceanicaulis sp.]|uniref:FMN-dependent NADH-azoreductase n=1 Tax=unclassified Oceanicaulis TaxID=2632123 RepID=UPI000C51E48B|nr:MULTISPECIES: NAD(P)H-dependent oxidoreductase [unclassified Oceanicaulis]MBC40452.1 FMN-dependent NADH-azoreductase [Oceanicaulis sp.]MBG35697.1 FMN-dependent NADH-azoreductase [Oceanicaulis sp.]HBU62253.1 FMN-dependent NADH-azoreductase [Oceanicaulis sp.]